MWIMSGTPHCASSRWMEHPSRSCWLGGRRGNGTPSVGLGRAQKQGGKWVQAEVGGLTGRRKSSSGVDGGD